MPKRIAPLTDTKVRTIKPSGKPQKLFDGGGLFLLVSPAGGKLWRLAYRFGGKQKLLSLGSYPDVSLARAREKRDDARRLLADGIDPSAKRKAEKMATADTFRAVAEEFLTQREKGWAPTHASKVKARLEWLYPLIGNRPIGAIEAPELLRPVRTIEECGKGETAKADSASKGGDSSKSESGAASKTEAGSSAKGASTSSSSSGPGSST